MLYLLALVLGAIAGLRTMTPIAAVSWAAYLGKLKLAGTWLAFFGAAWAPWVFTLAAIAELITDQLPKTPSRKVPIQFGARIASGALCGAAVGMAAGSWLIGMGLGGLGAILGTLAGAQARGRLASRLRADRPAAFIEDAVAIGTAALLMVLVA
jgi:uncharacterized membrane protein